MPVEEFLSQLERRVARRRKEASAALSEVHPSRGDDRICQLHTPDQAFQRCREMLARCEEIALRDVFPGCIGCVTAMNAESVPLPHCVCFHRAVFEPNKRLMHVVAREDAGRGAPPKLFALDVARLLHDARGAEG